MKTMTYGITLAAVIIGAYFGINIIMYTSPKGGSDEMAKFGKAPATTYKNGQWVDDQGDPQPAPGASDWDKIAQGGEVAVTGKYDYGKYNKTRPAEPAFNYAETQKPASREPWGDAQKPSAITAAENKASAGSDKAASLKDQEAADRKARYDQIYDDANTKVTKKVDNASYWKGVTSDLKNIQALEGNEKADAEAQFYKKYGMDVSGAVNKMPKEYKAGI